MHNLWDLVPLFVGRFPGVDDTHIAQQEMRNNERFRFYSLDHEVVINRPVPPPDRTAPDLFNLLIYQRKPETLRVGLVAGSGSLLG